MSNNKEYPHTKDIIYMIGMGALIMGTLLLPGLGYVARSVQRAKQKQMAREFEKYNLPLLKRNLKRLQERKIIKLARKTNSFELTESGQDEFIKLKMQKIDNKRWDGKWRIVIYDISDLKKGSQETLRRILKQIKFLQIQKSVYLTPFKCNEEIEYLKKLLNLHKEIILFETNNLENTQVYMKYFGL